MACGNCFRSESKPYVDAEQRLIHSHGCLLFQLKTRRTVAVARMKNATMENVTVPRDTTEMSLDNVSGQKEVRAQTH